MNTAIRMRQYQQQAVLSSSPEQLVLKMYDLAIASCNRGDRSKLRAVLVELLGSLNMDDGGEIATGLRDLYEYCLVESANGDLSTVRDLLDGLRDAWRNGVMTLKAA
ncbi:MAG: flagellar export chaperone FliS [Bacteroidota bacterium]